jgi:hypothetical protein
MNPDIQAAQKEMARLYKEHGNNRSDLELDKLVLLAKLHPNDRQEVLNFCSELEKEFGMAQVSGGVMMAGSL